MQISQSKRVSLSSSQQNENEQRQPRKALLKGLNGRQLLVIAMLAVANFFATVTFSSIVPFFPTEAIHQKGLSTTQVGLVIGAFQLVMFIVSPLIGKNMAMLGPNRAFSGGILLSGLATISFGLANFLPPGTPFFVGILAIRFFQAIGSAFFSTGSWAIVGRLFPDRISMITGINEVSYGVGFTLGPPMGSALYEVGGYLLPLLVVGLAQLLVALLSMPLHFGTMFTDDSPSGQEAAAEDKDAGRHPGVFQLLFIPDVLMTMVSLFVVCFAWSYYEPILAQHLSTFPVDWTVSMLVGAMMTMLSTSYLVSAPLLGFLMDRYLANQRTPMILFGGLLVFVSCLLMGPAPFLGLPKSLFCMGVAFVLLGIAGAILYVPVFQWCVNAAKSRGFDEKSPALCGLISGFFQSTTSLGAFLGTALGGLSAEKIGFEWTATWVAGMELVQLGLQLIYALAKRWRRSHQWQQQRIVPAKIHEIK